MSKIVEVCRYVRSKNAGPFWVTVDLFFLDEHLFRRYREAPSLGPELFKQLYGADPILVTRRPVDALRVIKISFPRTHPQGWMGERDMHGGQQYVRLLNVELD
jgi:hypothetical protein